MVGLRDPERLRRYFEAVVLNTAGVVDDRTLYQAAGIDRKTALVYDRLLQNLLVVEEIPAWATNRLKRLVQTPKRFVVDPAFFGGILRLTDVGVLRDGNILGRLIETFVVGQLRAELPLSDHRLRLFHLRHDAGRHEVDLIIEVDVRRILAIEIKATSAPSRQDARHLIWLRDELGDDFLGGVVFHTGRHAFELDDRIAAIPICSIWSDE